MGCPDIVHLHGGIALPQFDADTPAEDLTWHTKHFSNHPPRDEYKITEDGRLMCEDAERSVVPEDDRPLSDDEDFDESPLKQMYGMLDKERVGWIDMGFHGIVRITAMVDEDHLRYDLKFTDGELVDVMVGEGSRFPRTNP